MIEFLVEGGNVTATNKKTGVTYNADKIPLEQLTIEKFRKNVIQLFNDINEKFKKKFNYPLWNDFSIVKSGLVFNGSTSFIMDPNIDPKEILKYKKSAGDIDIMVPKEKMKDLWYFLDENEGLKIGDFEYLGNNRLNPNAIGDQQNTLWRFKNINFQVDFEEAEFENEKPSEWAKFAHGSSFEDAKTQVLVDGQLISVKSFAHKLILRAMVGALSENPNIVIATKASTPDKIKLKKSDEIPRMKQFSVVRGLGQGLRPMLDSNGNVIMLNGKQVYQEADSNERNYLTDLKTIVFELFGEKGSISDFQSFKGVVKMLKKTPKDVQIKTANRFFDIIFGLSAQVIEARNKILDYQVKMAPLKYLLDSLKIKIPNMDSQIDKYYKIKYVD